MRNHKFYTFLFYLGFVFLSGCAASSPNSLERASKPSLSEVGGGIEKDEPLTFEVESALNDGQLLHVLGKLETHTDIPASAVLLKVFGIQGGAVSYRESFPLEKILLPALSQSASTLGAGTEHKLYFRIPVAGLTDYQVQVVWGEEARAATPQKIPTIIPPQLRFEEVHVTLKPGCTKSALECEDLKVISALAVNEGKEAVREAPLLVGFELSRSRQLDIRERIQEYTWAIQGKGLDLRPGERKLLRFALAPDFEDKIQRLLLSKYGIRESWRDALSPFVSVNSKN